MRIDGGGERVCMHLSTMALSPPLMQKSNTVEMGSCSRLTRVGVRGSVREVGQCVRCRVSTGSALVTTNSFAAIGWVVSAA